MPHTSDIRPEPYRPPTRDEIEGARDWYAQGFTVSRVLARWDMALGTLYYWLDGGPGGEKGQTLLPPIPRRKHVVGKRRRPLRTDRVSLTARLWRTAERQVRDIEERLSVPGRASPERERDVRMLASLTRTLRDLSAFDVFDLTGAGGKAGAAAVDNDPPPEDPDEFRNELARRLEAVLHSKEAESREQALHSERQR